MATSEQEKMVDGHFLAELMSGSYESVVAAVDEAVMASSDLFHADPEAISTLATYAEHIIVANRAGEFFRAKWSKTGDGGVKLEAVEQIEVPVFESSKMITQVREEAREAVAMLLANDQDGALEKMRWIGQMARSGVRLTAESVADSLAGQNLHDQPWLKATRAKLSAIRTFIGSDSSRLPVSKPQFEALSREEVGDALAEAQRKTVSSAIGRLVTEVSRIRSSIEPAFSVTEQHRLRGATDDAMSVSEFIDFVEGLAESLDSISSILEDAKAVSDTGSVKCLARVHDGIASVMPECALATAFCEKLSRRFAIAA